MVYGRTKKIKGDLVVLTPKSVPLMISFSRKFVLDYLLNKLVPHGPLLFDKR